jgi:hypothetical protein
MMNKMDEYGVVRRCKILMRTTNLRGARVWRDRAFLSSRGRVRSLFFLASSRASLQRVPRNVYRSDSCDLKR